MTLSVLVFVFVVTAYAAINPDPPDDSMGQHYYAAQKALAGGHSSDADREYRKFISEALRRLADRRAATGDLAKSVALMGEAIEVEPGDADLQLDYAGACLATGHVAQAKESAERVLEAEPRNSKAQLEMGQILSRDSDPQAALVYFERAVALDPNFENGYALAQEYLKLKNPQQASKIFLEMQTGLGDSPELRMEIGSAYAQAGYPERAIPEFEKAISLNAKIRGGHYSLGASYLLGLGNAAQTKAELQFREELRNYPRDAMSLYQLSSIEFSRHDFESAERNLGQAAKSDPENPDIFLLLGQIYSETGRTRQAEMALHQSIALTTDVARNNYQVQRAHYLLARTLMKSGEADEARKEMEVANELLKRSTVATQGLTAPPQNITLPEGHAKASDVPNLRLRSEADAFERQIEDAVADSYNNLAAMAASKGNFSAALPDFQNAAKWNPSTEGLDYNWGRAAFLSGDYQQAVGPLSRHLRSHSSDDWARAALGSSYFSLQKYGEAKQTLGALAGSLSDRPQLDYIYAVSQLESGETDAGLQRLEALQETNPNIALIPEALAEGYESLGETEKAAHEREIAKNIHSQQRLSAEPAMPRR